jgi:hypothetical protein
VPSHVFLAFATLSVALTCHPNALQVHTHTIMSDKPNNNKPAQDAR